jgi:hypothetical protein
MYTHPCALATTHAPSPGWAARKIQIGGSNGRPETLEGSASEK